ncbi:hypothetical protein MVEN_00877800 [Mycena venus]|uniref:Uncharacterized protein n=1 Tax=Mycena venus TaxID=2733690 RepID=A0A8H7D1Q5_9AGAR|nr:hypothetical protein MVEN_00877800 [Mycena venus]
MLRLDAILPSCAILLLSITGANAQDEAKFVWGFTQTISTSLPSCQTLSISTEPVTGHGVPPFYMIAYPVGGAPITSFIGKNETNLNWTVTHPVGTQLMLGVVDSQGKTGGIDVPLYTVTQGSTTACIPPPPSSADALSPFTISSNVTDKLSTCQPWGLTMHGGIPPYNVSIVALNTTVVNNYTLGADDTVITWINRQQPNKRVLAAVSDMSGRWATGSPLVNTQGSTDTYCRGFDTTSSNGTSPSSGNNDSSGSHHLSRGKIGAIVGAIVGALLLFGAAAWLWRRRQRLTAQQRQPRVDIDPFEGPNTTDVYDIGMRPRPSSVLVSTDKGRPISTKESRLMAAGSLSPTSERFSSTNTSPLTSPHMFVHELPPSLSPVSPSTSRGFSGKEGHRTATTSLAPTSDQFSSTDNTPVSSPHVVIHELPPPPPYASPRLGEE